jgi:hypothetical protein
LRWPRRRPSTNATTITRITPATPA